MTILAADGVIASATMNGVVTAIAGEAVVAAVVISVDGIGIIVSSCVACPVFKFCFDPLIVDEDQAMFLLA